MAATMALSNPMTGTLLNSNQRLSSRFSSHIAGESLVAGQNIQQTARMSKQSLVLRAQPVAINAKVQESEESSLSSSVKKVAIAAAAALLLSTPAVNVSSAYAADPATEILNNAKQAANKTFASAQKSGAETVGQSASAPKAQTPSALSQLDPSKEESPIPKADQIVARADVASSGSAPGTTQQQGKGTNPVEKSFATPTRGIGDKEGEVSATALRESSEE